MTSPASPPDRDAETRRDTMLALGVLVALIVLKTFALGASGSMSVLASLADSTLDLIAALATLFAVRWAARTGGDRSAKGKAEAMAALVQAGLVFASALFIGWEAIDRIFAPRPVTGGGWAVGVMLIAIAVTGWMIWRQSRPVAATDAQAVSGNRASHIADLAASVVVLIGLVSGAFLRAPGLDAVAGLIVMVWLFWGAVGTLKGAADRLLDRDVRPGDADFEGGA